MPKQDQNTQQRKATPITLSIFSNKLFLHKLPILMPAVATCGFLALVSIFFVSADSAFDTYAVDSGNQITTEVDGQYYVTLTTSDVNFSVAPSKNENAAKQRVDVGVETNVAGGAKLYLAMGSNSNSLHLNGNTAQSAPVIAAVADGTDVNNFAANTWGYSTDDQTYSPVPTAAGDPALLATVDGETVGSTSGSVISASVPVYYAAKVDTSIPAGSYSNRVTYSAVVDGGITTSAMLTKIEIDGEEAENLQSEVENVLEITTNLMANVYGTPRVYYDAASPSGYQECGSVVVGRNESGYMTITCRMVPTQAATGVTFHVVSRGSPDDLFCVDDTYQPDTSSCEAGDWKWGDFEVSAPDIIKIVKMTDISTMQEMTSEFCSSVPSEGSYSTAQLQDVRDGKYYWAGKLTDGNCWMTQNLDLDLSTYNALNSSTSDVLYSWTPKSSTTTNISHFGYNDNGASYDPGDVYYESVDDSHYHVGNYYQWSAAMAGSSDQSICPKGWSLPTVQEFIELIDSGLTGSNFMNPPYYLVRGGSVAYSRPSGGANGTYWSSTPHNSNGERAHAMFFSDGYISTASNEDRSVGRSVRCVATSS